MSNYEVALKDANQDNMEAAISRLLDIHVECKLH